jgi:eukaryotic-like serine/threonine-protein kinase
MPATESVFRNSALASGLVTPAQLDYALRIARHRLTSMGKPPSQPIDDRLLANICVEQNTLTPYQADQLCTGRTKLKLGPYVITDFIGQGGMGQVFKAVHQVMGRECAVKVLPLTKANEEARISFAREIRMQAKLDCAHLVRAYDAGQDRNVHYLVTEYVPGMDLRRLIRARGPLPLEQAAAIIMQAALGLEYAHQQGLIHRDVKPGNVLVTPEGIAKVSDVGLAGFASDLLDDPRAGKIVGTADYLSPEQIKTPLQVAPVSDIYSLGCTLYYAVCGKVPFPGGDTPSKVKRHLSETPWHPRRFVPNISEEFVDIIADMMEKDPTARIQSAAEVAARLEAWAGDAGQLTNQRMTRSPWMAPPPPVVDADGLLPAEPVEAYSQDTSQVGLGAESTSSANSDSSRSPMFEATRSPSSTSVLPPPISDYASMSRQKNARYIIALTIAIVVPPALLVGAILGFLAFRSM